MTTFQKIVKYAAIAFAVVLIIGIVGFIVAVIGNFAFGIFGDAVLDENKTYTVSGEISNVRIKINAADFYIKEGESFSVESNLKYLEVEESGDTLRMIETKKRSARDYDEAVFIFTVPKDFVFENADITTGAGMVTIGKLSAKNLELELGAGAVVIEELNATTEADISGGAGEVTVKSGILNNLEFDMGVGELNLKAKITGDSDIDLGVGEANLRFIGSDGDYRLDIEKAIGSIMVDGENISKNTVIGSGENRVDISGGVGTINIAFTE